jgi:adenylate kinase
MSKRVILITGTPCTGKTTIAKKLATKLDALYINLTELAHDYSLTLNEDEQRKTTIIDEEKMKTKLAEIVDTAEKHEIIVDGHYAAAVTPKTLVTRVFVLRRSPIELRRLMEKRDYSGAKLWENLASEVLDICLIEALQEHGKEKVCELDITGKTANVIANEILAILDRNKSCPVGIVDWLGLLETQGILDQYLNF